MREHDIRSGDGTRIRVWRAGRTGPDVLLCPGLGTMPEAWPVLCRDDPGVRVHSWYHRGTLGSERPADVRRITVADHVADALAVLDDAGIERAVLLGWSVGVGTAVRLALEHPDRVSGLLLVAGPPGDVFGGFFGVLGLPLPVRRRLAIEASRWLQAGGPVVNAVLHRVPVNPLTVNLARYSGLLRPSGSVGEVMAAGKRFLTNDWGWYGRLARAFADERPPDLRGLSCPVTMLTGRYDVIADPAHAAAPLAVLPQARVRVLPTSHFLALEAPDELLAELRLLIARAEAVTAALRWHGPEPVSARAR